MNREIDIRTAKVFSLLFLVMILSFIVIFALTAGCMSAAKAAVFPTPEPTPVPTPTPTPTPTPEPTPEPTPDYSWCPMCYNLRDFHFWFRDNVTGYQDMRTHVTVYGYQFLPMYHYWGVSWARYFQVEPKDGYKFLFIYVNMYSDADDVRQYLFPKEKFRVQVKDKFYFPYEENNPTWRIRETEEIFNYNCVEGLKPYGYKIVQDIGTGVIHADQQFTLYSGRNNAADGYIIFQVPDYADENNTKIAGDFANLGGVAWWNLKYNIAVSGLCKQGSVISAPG